MRKSILFKKTERKRLGHFSPLEKGPPNTPGRLAQNVAWRHMIG